MLSQPLSSAFATNTGWWESARERERIKRERREEKSSRVRQTERMRIQGDRNNSVAREKQGWAQPGRKKSHRRLWHREGAQHLSHLFQLLTVNPQLAHPSPRCRTRNLLTPRAALLLWVCLWGLAIVVAKYTKQAWMTTGNLILL